MVFGAPCWWNRQFEISEFRFCNTATALRQWAITSLYMRSLIKYLWVSWVYSKQHVHPPSPRWVGGGEVQTATRKLERYIIYLENFETQRNFTYSLYIFANFFGFCLLPLNIYYYMTALLYIKDRQYLQLILNL